VDRLRWTALGIALLMAAVACGRGDPAAGQGIEPGDVVASFLSVSLPRLVAGQEAAPVVDRALARSIARAARELAPPGGRLQVEARPNGGPRFDVPMGEGRRLLGMDVSLSMAVVDAGGRTLRELVEPSYDLMVAVRAERQRWVVERIWALPWLDVGEQLETGGCDIAGGVNHRFGVMVEMRRSDVLQLPITGEELRAIERAWRCYWLVTAEAFSSLDDSRLHLVSAGPQLERDLAHVAARRTYGIALEEEAVHRSPVLVQYTGNRATVDEWFDGRGRGVGVATGVRPDWTYRAGHLTFLLERTPEGWRVVNHAFVSAAAAGVSGGER